MDDLAYRTSFVLCSLPFVAVVSDLLGLRPRFSGVGFVLGALVWIVLLQRIGRGGTPAGASAREVAILRPGPRRLLALLMADNASRVVLCLAVALASFGRAWPFIVALFLATRLVGLQLGVALAGCAGLGLAAAWSPATATTVAGIGVGVLSVTLVAVAYARRWSLRAVASGADGSDARIMVQLGDWHGLVDRLGRVGPVPAVLVWLGLGAATLTASELVHLPRRLVVPIVAFAAAHVACRVAYAASVQPDRRRLAIRAAGSPARLVLASVLGPLVVGAVMVGAAVPWTGRAIASAAAVAWLLVMAESLLGGLRTGLVTQFFGPAAFGGAGLVLRSLPVAVAVGLAYVPAGAWSTRAVVGGPAVAAVMMVGVAIGASSAAV